MRRKHLLFVAVLLFLAVGPVCAQQGPPLIPLAEAGHLANVDRLQRVDTAFRDTNIPLPYPVFVQESNEINAYADGTKIVVYTGLLDFVDSEGQVAYVLGHELAHNVRRHVVKQYGTILGLVVVNAALSRDYQYQPGHERDVAATEIAQDATLVLLATSYGRVHEYDADRNGLYDMVRAGYDPNDALRFQEKLLQRYGSGDALGGIFSTHPPSRKRIEQMKHIVEDEYEQDPNGKWHRKAVPKTQPRQTSGRARVDRGTKMALWTGGVSLLVGGLEQLQFESQGWVNRKQRDHNILTATRNGLVMGFLAGYLLIVDVPGSRPPQFQPGSGASEKPVVTAGFDPSSGRWALEATLHF